MNKKKGIISLILTVVLIGLLGFTTIVGFGDAHIGASKNIKLGLDLAGGVSITYQVKNDNPTSEEMSDTIYKLQRRVEQYSTEASVYQEGDDRINIEIPGVTDANKILDELGKPGSLEFQDPNGETVITGSDVKTATVKTGQDDLNNKEYSVELTLNDDGTKKFADATTEFVGQQISIIYDGETISAPSVKQAITGGQAYITGNFTYEEAENLASTIRIGGFGSWNWKSFVLRSRCSAWSAGNQHQCKGRYRRTGTGIFADVLPVSSAWTCIQSGIGYLYRTGTGYPECL